VALPDFTIEQASKLRNQQVKYRGWVLGLRHSPLLVLEERGLALSQEQEARVASSRLHSAGMFTSEFAKPKALTASSTDNRKTGRCYILR
jgi:hypothetical protein